MLEAARRVTSDQTPSPRGSAASDRVGVLESRRRHHRGLRGSAGVEEEVAGEAGARSGVWHLGVAAGVARPSRRRCDALLMLRRVSIQIREGRLVGANDMSTRAEEQTRAEIVEAGRRMYARGYVASNDGNISARLDESRILTTPKSVSKGFM